MAKPLYALRHAGPGRAEDVAAVGAPVFAVQRSAKFVNPSDVQQQQQQQPVRPLFLISELCQEL